MRFFTFLLFIAFIIVGFVLPSSFGINAYNNVETYACDCDFAEDGTSVCEEITNKGYVFYTYVLNVLTDTLKQEVFICEDGFEADIDVQADTNFTPTFFESRADAENRYRDMNGFPPAV